MPKGKKFDAAQKHFLEKEKQLRKEMHDLEERTAKAEQAARELKIRNAELEKEIEETKAVNAALAESLGMDIESFKKHMKNAENVNSAFKLILGLSRLSHDIENS